MFSLAAIQTNNYWQNRRIVLFVVIWFCALTKLRLTQIENRYYFKSSNRDTSRATFEPSFVTEKY